MSEALLSIVGVTLLCMLSPGPDMALVMRNTLLSGRAAGLATSGGVLTGNLLHIASAAFGLGLLVAHHRAAYVALLYAGAAYLLWLGLNSLVSAWRSAPTTFEEVEPAGPPRRAFVQGIVNNLLNAKGALFYLGVFTQLITPQTPPFATAILVSAMIATSALFWLVFVATLERAAVRRFIARARRGVDATFGIVLVALAVRVVLSD